MKARKMWMNAVGDLVGPKGSYYTDPVLVIDASKFPKDAPEIGSEWLYGVSEVRVVGIPERRCDNWAVPCRTPNGLVDLFISSLKPIPEEPKTAKGEVVSGFKVADGCTEKTIVVRLPEGEYDIIKRGDT